MTHDSRGNITQSETGKKYAWDFDGHMSSNDGDGNNTADVTYAYDALGRRVSRTAGGTTLVFCNLKHDTIGEYTSGSAPGSPQRTYIHGQRIDEPVAMISGSNTYYYHADASTSIRALTTTAGAVSECYKYTAYGSPTILSSSLQPQASSLINNRYLFTAREYDDALTSTTAQQSGSYYFRARWLSPTLGRFIGRDPLSYVDGPGLYRAYFVPRGQDPDGRMAHWMAELLGGCAAGAAGGAIGQLGVETTAIFDALVGGSIFDITTFLKQPCWNIGCAGLGSCVTGGLTTVLLANTPPGFSWGTVGLSCLAGGLGSLVGSLCQKGSDMNDCDLYSAIVGSLIGCFGGTAGQTSHDDQIAWLMGTLGIDMTATAAVCEGLKPPKKGPRYVCCRTLGWFGTGNHSVPCPEGQSAFGCCAADAVGWLTTNEVIGASEGRCRTSW